MGGTDLTNRDIAGVYHDFLHSDGHLEIYHHLTHPYIILLVMHQRYNNHTIYIKLYIYTYTLYPHSNPINLMVGLLHHF